MVGQKAPFKPKDIWALRVRLQMEGRVRELALFNLGKDSKLRGCDLVALKVGDVGHGDLLASRAIVMQHKIQRPVQFEITQATRDALQALDQASRAEAGGLPVPQPTPRLTSPGDPTVRPDLWALGRRTGVDRADYWTHSVRRTKATLIYRRTTNLRAVQLLLGHSKLGVDGEVSRHRRR